MKTLESFLFSMAGTEMTFEYVVLAAAAAGRVGYRKIGETQYRVRLEPTHPAAATAMAATGLLAGWKQPGNGGQFRFSTVVGTKTGRDAAITTALRALYLADAEGEFTFNPELRPRLAKLVSNLNFSDLDQVEEEETAAPTATEEPAVTTETPAPPAPSSQTITVIVVPVATLTKPVGQTMTDWAADLAAQIKTAIRG
jgi:hypothetical protein